MVAGSNPTLRSVTRAETAPLWCGRTVWLFKKIVPNSCCNPQLLLQSPTSAAALGSNGDIRVTSTRRLPTLAAPDGCASLLLAGTRRPGVAALRRAGAWPPRASGHTPRTRRAAHPSPCPSHAGIDGARRGVELRHWRVELLLSMPVCRAARRFRVRVRVGGICAASVRAIYPSRDPA